MRGAGFNDHNDKTKAPAVTELDYRLPRNGQPTPALRFRKARPTKKCPGSRVTTGASNFGREPIEINQPMELRPD